MTEALHMHDRELAQTDGDDPSAVEAFSPLPRAIFLLHKIKRITHAEIAERLDITQVVVECSIAHVLTSIVRIREGKAPQPCIYPNVEIAEAKLRAAFQIDQAAWKTASSLNGLGGSRTLRAWGGHTDFDAWLWHQGTAG
jgi:hypothetical protein